MTSVAPIEIARFDTDAYGPTDRHEAWAKRDWPAIGMLFSSTPMGAFYNRTMRFALGTLTVHHSRMGAQRYERTARDAQTDGSDQLLIPITLSGTQAGDASGRAVRVAPGDFALVDLARPERHVSSDSETIMLSVPRRLIEQDGLRVSDLHGEVVAAPVATLFRQHLVEVCRIAPALTIDQGRILQNTTFDLLKVTLAMAGVGGTVPTNARNLAQMTAARSLIEEALALPGLTVDWLSGRLGISRSSLYRMFEKEGGVLAHIRRRRLLRVRRSLADPHSSDRIGDLAAEWGFSDAAHLSRLFRQEFGVSPREFRRESQSSGDRAGDEPR